ncbi:hypothetical protein CEQ90_03165 [Lewinellaceae bacterium SD302]|nr:hypothetical protein CEQ90_03165 [Lewinellaceae bacterium SD302]
MKQALQTLLLCLLATAGFALSAQNTEDRNLQYIERFKDIAIQEMERAGIPASIKLAQGLLESGSGTSYLARNANNHFGIKCGSNWNGKEVYREDDDYDDKGKLMKSCFRGYRNANASFVAHSEFLRDPKKAFRYGFLFRLNPQDYERWAEGLRRAGYATDPAYPEKLISRIEKYNLDQYDRLPISDDNFVADDEDQNGGVTRPGTITRPGRVPANPPPTDVDTPIENLVTGFLNTNDVTFFVSDEAISVDEVARRVDISLRKLIEYNEPISSGGQQVLPGQRVFIQKKRNSYRGKDKYHTMQAGETLQEISDRYAIRMDKLLKRNRLISPDQRVAPGEQIKLRGSKVKTAPRLGGAPAPTPENPSIPTDADGNLDLDTDSPTIPPVTPDPNPAVTPQPSPPIPNPDIGTGQPDFGTPSPNPAPPNPPVTEPTDPPYTPPSTPPQQPTVTPTPQPTVTPPVTEPPVAATKFHSVVKGDTLYNISRRYGLTVDRLKQLNGLTSNTISIGQRLQVQ